MRNQIASYEGRFDVKQVVYLLSKDWPDKIFDLRTVANAIQKGKIEASRNDGSEAAELFKLLRDKAREDKETTSKNILDEDLLKIFPLTPSLTRDDQAQLSKKRRFGEISGLMKDIIKVVDSNPDMFEMVKESLDHVIVKRRGYEGMKDSVHVKAKGRPKMSRMKSSMEVGTRSTRCRVCNKLRGQGETIV
ncbi:hypothetical protein BGZ58_001905 [Dissophora ornata]|nr:hypothetical protein BGZ58_001905 [Dissophora ornata]